MSEAVRKNTMYNNVFDGETQTYNKDGQLPNNTRVNLWFCTRYHVETSLNV